MLTNYEELKKLGTHVKGVLDQHIKDRALLEVQWMKNLRQYLRKYDPDVLARIPDERSHVYPEDTRIKVKGGVAKMMEMMFPSQDKNWGLSVSPSPSIPQTALQTIIDSLQQQELALAQQEQRPAAPITSDAIEREVRTFAEKRKEKMETEIADQLADPGIDYPQLCKKVVRSGYLYGFGIARSPMVRTQAERVWTADETGQYVAKTKTLRRPYPEYVRMWDVYPDLSAIAWTDQDAFFERIIFLRHDFRALAKRPDFEAKIIKEYLKDHSDGNYAAKEYEADLHDIAKTSNLANRQARRYEVYRGLMFVSAHTLQSVGVEVSDNELDEDILADVWIIDDVVIKAEKAAFGERPSDQYHAFIYTEDEDSGLTGVGLPEEVRDAQMSLCMATRMLADNASACAGPIYEVNESLLPRGRKNIGPIHSFMTITREGDGPEAQYPAVRALITESHITELISMVEMYERRFDVASNLPAYTMGAMQNQPLGEAFRTTSNMSMMTGSANMVTKDTVRAFDKFTTSLLTSMLAWNMEFNPNEELKGDYQVVAKGNLSLVAKEVRGAALDQFVMTLTPEERAILDTHGLLIDRLKARDLPVDRVLPEDEAKQILEGMKQAASQASQIEQGLTQAKTEDVSASAAKKQMDVQMLQASADATIQEILSRVEQNLANAKSAKDKNQLENLKVLLTTVSEKKEGAKPKGDTK
jgi:hypothetical protein